MQDWLWELVAQGVACRLRGVGNDLVIVPTNRVREISPSSAAATLQRVLAKQPQLAAEALRIGTELRGNSRARARTRSEGGGPTGKDKDGQNDVEEAVSAIHEALSQRTLVALQIRHPEVITEAEAQMLEELRLKRSVAAPPLPLPPPPVEESLREYRIRVVDDTNSPIDGVRLKLEIEGTPRITTSDASGVASIQWFSKAPASVRILDQQTLEQNLESSWLKPRSPTLPAGANVHTLAVGTRFAEFRAPADDETTVIITRPSTSVSLELVDGTGAAMAGLRYRLTCSDGSQRQGVLDAQGCASEDGLPSPPWTVDFPDLSSIE